MTNYQKQKDAARQKAIDWQREAGEKSCSWQEITEQTHKMERLARRYGLVREFRENGII